MEERVTVRIEVPAEEQIRRETQEAKQNIDFYLHKIGAERLDDLAPYDRRIMSEVPLLSRLHPIEPQDTDSPERQRVLKRFAAWSPKTASEKSMAMNYISAMLSWRVSHSHGNPEKAKRSVYHDINAMYDDATDELAAFRRAITDVGSENRPDANLIRSDHHVLYAMADRLMARDFLSRLDWPRANTRKYKDQQKYWRGFMLQAAQDVKDDKVLLDAHSVLSEEARQRQIFWAERKRVIDEKVGHLIVDHAVDVIAPTEPKKIEIKTKEDEPTDYEALIPEKAKKELELAAAAYDSKEHAIDNLVRQGIPQDLAERRVLGGRAVRYNGRVVGVEMLDTKPKRTPNIKSRRPKKTRRGLGPTQLLIADEAPPHERLK